MLDEQFWQRVNNWTPWFAWYPVRLLTWEWAWLRTVKRRPAMSGEWSYGKWDYAN
jgi:hypothetical protein